MEIWPIIEATGLSLLFLILVFFPMEKVFPAKLGQKFFRPQWLLDLCFFIGQYFLWTALVTWILYRFSFLLDDIVPQAFRSKVAGQPYWLQMIEVILLSDLFVYWGHRLQHDVDFLWRFHKVHHSVEHMDWLAAHREHPLDSIYTIGLINLPAFILGFPLETMAGLIAFRSIWAIYIHSNVRLNIGFLKKIIGSPELHHWHHDLDRRAGNYANLSPLMDIIFGTYKCPDKEPEKFGIEEAAPKTYIGHMVNPMVPKRFLKLLKRNKNNKESSIELQNVQVSDTTEVQ